MKLVFTPLAEGDLNEILSYIAEHRPGTARAVIQRIRERGEMLARHPFSGEKLALFDKNYRFFPSERWIIFYRVMDSAVEIHRVLDGARDWPSFLE